MFSFFEAEAERKNETNESLTKSFILSKPSYKGLSWQNLGCYYTHKLTQIPL
jgi:hypothetical protein